MTRKDTDRYRDEFPVLVHVRHPENTKELVLLIGGCDSNDNCLGCGSVHDLLENRWHKLPQVLN